MNLSRASTFVATNPLSGQSELFRFPKNLYVFFGLLLLGAVYSIFLPSRSGEESLLRMALLIIPLDAGHVYASIVPALLHLSKNKKSLLFLFTAPLIAAFFAFGAYAISPSLFFTGLAVWALFHICAQQIGWLMVSRRHYDDSLPVWLDKLMLWNIMLVPVVWWQSQLFPEKAHYWREGDFFWTFPDWVAKIAMVFHWALFIGYGAIILWKRKQIRVLNLSKWVLFLSTWLWFFGSLVILENTGLFFSLLIVIHGGAYILHNAHFSQQLNWRSHNISKGFMALLIWGASATVLWLLITHWVTIKIFASHVDQAALVHTHGFKLFMPLLFLPTMTHYVLDSWMWRKNPPWSR